MPDLPTLSAAEIDLIVFLVVGLIGLVTWIKEMLVRSAKKKRALEEQGEPEVPVSTKISNEIRKYLGEIPEKPRAPKPAVLFRAPPPLPERHRPEPEPRPEPPRKVKKKVRVARKKAPRPVRTSRGPSLDRAGLRQAMIFHEILGPPVSMRRRGRSLLKLTRR